MIFTKMAVTSLIMGHFYPDFAQQQFQTTRKTFQTGRVKKTFQTGHILGR